MAFDGIVTKAITNELKPIIGGKINKVFEPNKNNIILGIYANGKNFALNICIDSINTRIHLTTKSKPNPYQAPNFCMLLRKHLIGTRIKNIYTIDLERIVIIELEGLNDLHDNISKKLIIELMGKHSNIILVNDNNIIIDSLRHLDTLSNSKRDILPAHIYILPISEKNSFLEIKNFNEFYNLIEPNLTSTLQNNLSSKEKTNDNKTQISNTIDKIIANTFNGISISFIQNTLKMLKIENSSTISKGELENLYNYIYKLINYINQNSINKNNENDINKTNSKEENTINLDFNIIYKENSKTPKDFFISYLNSNSQISNTDNSKSAYDKDLKNIKNTGNFFLNLAIDDFYFDKEENEAFKIYRNSILKLILDNLKKYSSRLKNINEKLKECEKMDTFRIYGELITSNLYQIKNENVDKVEVFNYYENCNVTIPLDKKFSPSINAKRYFKKYNKLKNTLEIVGEQKKQTEKELDYLESIVYELETSNTIEDVEEIFEEISENVIFKEKLSNSKGNIKQKINNKANNKSNVKNKNNTKNKKEEIPIKYTINGHTLLVGKNNKQNDYLTLKLAKPTDIWFHTKDIQGSHTILKLENPDHDFELSNINIQLLEECAQIAAYYSKAKNSSNVPVDYCFVKYVKKPRGSKPGMVIYTNNQTLNVHPLEPNTN